MSGRARTVMAAGLATALLAAAMPVHSFYQAHSFFKPSDKYREHFHETVWLQDTRAEEFARGVKPVSIELDKFTYRGPAIVTEERYRRSSEAIEDGRPDWFDAEIVRQRAEIEQYAPAMDFLGWMYEQGQGIDRDFQKAFMWYERAKLAGKVDLRGEPAKIFQRLDLREQFLANLQLTEDITRMKVAPQVGQRAGVEETKTFERVNINVLREQRETELARQRRELLKRQQAEDQ